MHDLTISIGTLDNFPVLERCLRSIYEDDSLRGSLEIWVVYNGSGDPAVPRAIAAAFPQVRLIVRPGPLGYCATHNIALRASRSRYKLVLDDDTILARGTLARMIEFMDANPRVGMSGCKTLNPDGTFQKTFGLVPRLATEWVNAFKPDAFWDDRLYADLSRVREVEWLNGSFMLARSEALDQVGLLDEYYYTYVCESDWCYRIRQAGWRVAWVPDVSIVHVGGQHSIKNKETTTNPFPLIRTHVNRFYFFRKHYGAGPMHLLRPIMILGCALRVARYALLYAAAPERRRSAAAKVRAFSAVIALSLSRRPYELPAYFPR
jgi:GT2 family glycosyltransferase